MWSVIYMLIFYIITQIQNKVFNELNKVLNKNINQSMKREVIRKILEKDFEFFDKYTQGELVQAIEQGSFLVNQFSMQQFIQPFNTIAQIVGSYGFMAGISEELAYYMVLLIPVQWAIGKITQQSYRQQHWKELGELQSKAYNVQNESFRNIRLVKAFSTEDKEINKLEALNEKIDAFNTSESKSSQLLNIIR